MKNSMGSTWVTLWVDRAIMIVLAVLVFAMPALVEWLKDVRTLNDGAEAAILATFYACVPCVALALWKMDALLRRILREEVFVSANVNCIRVVRWCCLAVSLLCLPASYFYPPLLFMTVIMAFLSLVVNVVSQVMKAAVAIREENDLTV